MPFKASEGLNVHFVRYGTDDKFPSEELRGLVWDYLGQGRLSRVAVMAEDEEAAFDALPKSDVESLEPDKNYIWSGWLMQRANQKPNKRAVAGTYADWFRWYMSSQRFRAFHTLILIDPIGAVSDPEHGGYIDGLLARLMSKVRQVIIISKPLEGTIRMSDGRRTAQVTRALLYGTRLSAPSLRNQAQLTFIPIPQETVANVLNDLHPWVGRGPSWYELEPHDERFLEEMDPVNPFERKERFRTEETLPDKMLSARAVEDVESDGWVTIPLEVEKLAAWLQELNREGDKRLRNIHESSEGMSMEQWQRLLYPRRNQVRKVLDGLVSEGRLERRIWYQEVGRPALAYVTPGRGPFLEERCGQCAFYATAKRRCNLWWLANKTRPFFDDSWKRNGTVTDFEIRKMKFSSKIGPHSSACARFIDKKRDHLRDAIPEQCEICSESIPKVDGRSVTCRNCKTRYIRLTERVKVMTAYEHEYNRLYREITGGDARTDLDAWRAKVKEDLRDRQKMFGLVDELDDVLGEERGEYVPRITKEWSAYNPALQDSVDNLAKSTDIARRLSMAMAQSALYSTRRILEFGRVYSGEATQLIVRQERYVGSVVEATPTKLMPYEALIMKQYWAAYSLALRGVQQWLGPRKRSRYVAELVEGPGGRAKGYSPLDAAINYLHQRRLNLAERTNEEVGFSGTCDGFLHRERYNSRKIGLLLDMIDPFKFADREELLLLALDHGLTWRDYRIEADRRGSSFYYPQASALPKLDLLGVDADNRVMRYSGIEASLTDGYRKYATSMLDALRAHNLDKFEPFVFNPV